jgi:hypothetical protein
VLEHLESRQVPSAAGISGMRTSGGDPGTFAIISSAGNSLWEYNPQYLPSSPVTAHWYEITSANVTAISATRDSAGDPVVFAIISSAGNSLWEYNPQYLPSAPVNAHWYEITSANVSSISATRDSAGDPVVFATISSDSNTLWEYNPQYLPSAPVNAHWYQISPAIVGQISATRDSGGDPVVFATIASDSNTLWEYNPQYLPSAPVNAHWYGITSANVGEISATQDSADDPVVFAVIASDSNSLWEYNPQYLPSSPVTAHWYQITSANVSEVSATQDSGNDPTAYATIASDSNALWEYNPQYLPSSPVTAHWYEITHAIVA